MNKVIIRLVTLTSFVLGLIGFAVAEPSPATKGRIPDDAHEDGRINLDKVPDFVAAYCRDGEECGYVRKSELFAELPRERDAVRRLEVVDESLVNVVGHMVTGRGFVPLGTSDDKIPRFASRTLVDE